MRCERNGIGCSERQRWTKGEATTVGDEMSATKLVIQDVREDTGYTGSKELGYDKRDGQQQGSQGDAWRMTGNASKALYLHDQKLLLVRELLILFVIVEVLKELQ